MLGIDTMNLLCRRRTKSKEDDTPIGIALVSFLVSFLVFYESESKCDILIVTRQLQASYHLSDTSRIYTLRLGQVFLSQSIFPIKLSREFDDPFHILLLDDTFAQNDRITIEYVASSCAYVLSMPYDEAAELASHAEQEGFSCLGTWGHEECLRLGKQLQQRDIVCRVVPFCEGGDRAWQARNADSEMKSANDDAGWD